MPRVYMAWHSPAMFAEGDAEMDLLADLLANGKTSRLYRTLVYEQRIALDVSAYQNSRELAGFFLLVATATPGRSLTEIASVIDTELQRVADEGPSVAEMERARSQTEAHFMYRLQTVGGFGGKSDQLNAYNVFLRRPGIFRHRSGSLPGRDGRRGCSELRAVISDSTDASSSVSCRAGSTRLPFPVPNWSPKCDARRSIASAGNRPGSGLQVPAHRAAQAGQRA